MAISLSKGQTISLAKDGGGGLSKVFMGLGWDPVVQEKKGFFGKLMGGGGDDIDLDASVVMFDANKTMLDAVWFQQLNSKDGSIRHGGDNLTGEGDGDDEVIYVDLTRLPAEAAHLVFTVNSFRGQTFNEVENSFARLVDDTNQSEICRYTLMEQGPHTGVIMASISKGSGGWQLTAHGIPASGRTVNDLADAAKSVI